MYNEEETVTGRGKNHHVVKFKIKWEERTASDNIEQRNLKNYFGSLKSESFPCQNPTFKEWKTDRDNRQSAEMEGATVGSTEYRHIYACVKT